MIKKNREIINNKLIWHFHRKSGEDEVTTERNDESDPEAEVEDEPLIASSSNDSAIVNDIGAMSRPRDLAASISYDTSNPASTTNATHTLLPGIIPVPVRNVPPAGPQDLFGLDQSRNHGR